MSHAVHPIEAESYRILRARVDLSHLPALVRAVTERVVHASADLEYADTLLADEAALRSGREALLAGAPVVCDTRMVAGGITRLGLGVPGGQGESAGGIFRFNLGARPEESEGDST